MHRTLEEWEAEQMKDPEFRAACEALEPEYQLARLRIQLKLANKRAAAWKRAAKRYRQAHRDAFLMLSAFKLAFLPQRGR